MTFPDDSATDREQFERRTATETIAGLRAARALVEKGWTQHMLARDATGCDVAPKSPQAVAWCASGACCAAMPDDAWDLFDALRSEIPNSLLSIPIWNDAPDRTQADVLSLFDRCIARLEREGGVGER